MLELAVSFQADAAECPIALTNRDQEYRCPRWPQDSEFQLVAATTDPGECEVVHLSELNSDLAAALEYIEANKVWTHDAPPWFIRLSRRVASS